MPVIDIHNAEAFRKGFIEGLSETISTMTGFYINKKNEFVDTYSDGEISGAMFLSGNRNTMLTLKTSRRSAAIIVKYMTGSDINIQNDLELCDCIAELINMTAGLAKTKLSDLDFKFKLSSPFSILGDNIKLVTKSNVERYEVVLGNDEIDLKLGLYYL